MFVVHHLVEKNKKDRSIDYLRTIYNYLVEQAKQVILDLYVLLLHDAELIELLQLELDGSSDYV